MYTALGPIGKKSMNVTSSKKPLSLSNVVLQSMHIVEVHFPVWADIFWESAVVYWKEIKDWCNSSIQDS